MKTFEMLESDVRVYCRHFPAVFEKAAGSTLFDENGKAYTDFFSGAGSLNYGHNNPRMKERLIEAIQNDFVTHSLDMATTAKRRFLERFNSIILEPRNFKYKIQFCGPTGANAVEAAIKLARKATGRQTVVFFTHSYHGLSLGSLAVTASRSKRKSAAVPLHFTMPMAFDGDLGPDVDTLDYLEMFLTKSSSGMEIPAAIIVETIQAEGGVRSARYSWLQRLESLCKKHGIVFIADDIQVGCGRTGTFFSFEEAGLNPDIVCLSKSISGYGLPMAILLLKPELDVWEPGEHSGTFRGNNLAFVTASEALSYWETDEFSKSIGQKAHRAAELLNEIIQAFPETQASLRGRGLIQGLVFEKDGLGDQVSREAFDRGLIIETSGPNGEVLKILPPLTITEAELESGIRTISESIESVLSQSEKYAKASPA